MESITYTDIIDDTNCVPDLLGTGTPVFHTQFHIELTLNHPRTKSFCNMRSNKQKELYRKHYNILKCVFGIDAYDENKSEYHFEYCQTGHIHLHASMYFDLKRCYNIYGAIADMAKTYHQMLPKKYANFKDSYMSTKFYRYQCPAICIGYNQIDNKKRIEEWVKYCRKHIEQV